MAIILFVSSARGMTSACCASCPACPCETGTGFALKFRLAMLLIIMIITLLKIMIMTINDCGGDDNLEQLIFRSDTKHVHNYDNSSKQILLHSNPKPKSYNAPALL